MGILSLVEDRPTPRAVYNARVVACALIASFASCMIGYDSAFIGTTIALSSFASEFRLSALTAAQRAVVSANIVSVYQAGAFFGALAAYCTCHALGRRLSLQLFALLFTLGAGLSLGATGARGLGLIYASRVLTGLGVGGASNVAPMYIAELAPPAARGRLVGLYELGWQIGGLVGFWINYGLSLHVAPSHKQWLIPFAVQLIPAGLLVLGAFWIRESPRWLFMKGRREDAIRNLCWVRRLEKEEPYIVEEIAQIENALAKGGTGFWEPFHVSSIHLSLIFSIFSPRIRRSLHARAPSNTASCWAVPSSSGKMAPASTPSTTTRPPSFNPSASPRRTRPSSRPASLASSRRPSRSSGSCSSLIISGGAMC
jgi:MFS family permease